MGVEVMRICKNCGAELTDNVMACPSCGSIAENSVEYQNNESQKPKKRGRFIGILIAVAIMIISRVIGGFIGERTAETISVNVQKNDIEKYIENMEKYVPGHCAGNEYVSEEFGFRFVIDENWEFYTDEDLKTSSEGLKTSTTASALAALEKEDVPRELKEKYAESIYAATEMGALYIADDMYVGEVVVGVMCAYGSETLSEAEYIKGVKNGLDANAQVTDEYIAGSTYKVLSAKVTDVDGNDTTVKMYVKIKNNMICMITCRAIEGYEEQTFKAFEEGISENK